ncbi:MAG TPA: GNAT family N-acetyltransferase [Coleofasciculaceae cyanobacterium]
MKNKSTKANLILRNATPADLIEILALSEKVYPDIPPYSIDVLRGQLNNYPEGQFVAVYDKKIVGYCATIRVSEEVALAPHNWCQITGGGYGSTHLATGEYLYGMEIFVDPDYRGLRIGECLYSERKKLCRYYRLKGIVFGGRMPLLKKRLKQVETVENQCSVVMSGNVGNLPRVHNMDIQYAQSCILTPCDFYFARVGIAADTTPNVETVAFADLRLEYINRARHSGTVMNLKDRRHDLYSVVWHKKEPLTRKIPK